MSVLKNLSLKKNALEKLEKCFPMFNMNKISVYFLEWLSLPRAGLHHFPFLILQLRDLMSGEDMPDSSPSPRQGQGHQPS